MSFLGDSSKIGNRQQSDSRGVKMERYQAERIRNRASYELFRQLYEFLKSKPGITEILRKFYDVLDDRRSFGSRRNTGYAEESLSWVLKDNGCSK